MTLQHPRRLGSNPDSLQVPDYLLATCVLEGAGLPDSPSTATLPPEGLDGACHARSLPGTHWILRVRQGNDGQSQDPAIRIYSLLWRFGTTNSSVCRVTPSVWLPTSARVTSCQVPKTRLTESTDTQYPNTDCLLVALSPQCLLQWPTTLIKISAVIP